MFPDEQGTIRSLWGRYYSYCYHQVLEFRAPESPDLAALLPIIPQFLAYVLSFIF